MMTTHNCQAILAMIKEKLGDRTETSDLGGDGCIVRLPFADSSGDPIEIAISTRGDVATVDDTGAIAGLLFSLGQHTEDTPGFKLLKALEATHELRIDFDEGLVKLSVPLDELFAGVLELCKIVLAMDTAAPHIRVTPRRIRPVGGTRLKHKIQREYQAQGILDLVERDFSLEGATVKEWPVDYHWSIPTSDNTRKDVYVIAADLDVVEPLIKAEKIAALSIDTRDQRGDSALRVVMDTHGANGPSEEAVGFLRFHSRGLGFEIFDFNQMEERNRFVRESYQELTEANLRGPWVIFRGS